MARAAALDFVVGGNGMGCPEKWQPRFTRLVCHLVVERFH
jgi:hypothetical protein